MESHIYRNSKTGGGSRSYCIVRSFLCFHVFFISIGMLALMPLSPANAAPDTIIIAGPSGTLNSSDLAFWWTGKTTTTDTYIKGFYYRLDGESWNWTRERFITYYGISSGGHKLEVKAVDSANAEDPSPASRSFTVASSSAVEPDESSFSVDLDSLGFEIDLNSRVILDGLRQELKDDGITISQNARISVESLGNRWVITDGNDAYTARREGSNLKVYEGVASFRIKSSFDNELDDGGDVSEDLREEFDDEDVTLSENATISVLDKDSIWKITDGGDTYTIRKEDNDLNVYEDEGSPIIIGQQDYIISCLDEGAIPGSLRQEFLNNGIMVSQSAVVASGPGGTEWLASDSGEVYIIRRENDELIVYQSINDESSEATTIAPGVAIECLSQPDGDDGGVDDDWFRVSVEKQSGQPAPRQIAVFFRRPDSVGSTTIKLYQHPRLNQEIGSFQAEDRAFFATGAVVGDYLIHIVPNGESDTAPYFLTVATDSLASEIVWDTEHNESSNDATESASVILSRSTPWAEMVGNRWANGDGKDWFKIHIDVNKPTKFNLNLTRPAGGSTDVTLYQAALMSEVGEFVVTTASNPQWKLEAGVELGEYLLEVGLNQHDLDSPYFLTLNLSDFPADEAWEQEPNDLPDFANQLPVGTRVRATKGHSGDTRDWFRFASASDGIFNLTTSRILELNAVNIYLIDPILLGPAGAPLPYEVQTGQQSDSLNLDISAGDYLIEVDLTKFSSDYWLVAMFIASLEHSAPEDEALAAGDILSVEMVWEPGNSATFDISTPDGFLNDAPIPMYDDGFHGDGQPNDGVYVGTYTVASIDDEENENYISTAWVTAHLKDQSGNMADVPVGNSFTIDVTPPDDMPPEIYEIRHNAADGFLRVGEELIVTIEGEAENTATFDIGEFSSGLPAFDDGKHGDGNADDGVYVGVYTVAAVDYVAEAVITGYLADETGNTAELDALPPIDIVGNRPVINSIDHDTRLTLGKGDILKVTMIGDADGIASFDIEGLASSIPMYDDGQHGDGGRGDGRYVGVYEVVEDDGVLSAIVTVHLLDRSGRKTSKNAPIGVNIDAIAPAPVIGVGISDRPDDQGKFLVINWDVSSEADFSNYNIYLSKDISIPVSAGRVVGLSPVISDITNPDQASVEIEIDFDLTDYYAAVTAVDAMGNESLLDAGRDSVAGPAQASDNLKPTPVRMVIAVDKDQDFGGTIILSWTEVNQDTDFVRYNIYQETFPVISTDGLTPVDNIFDRYVTVVDVSVAADMDYYFAVTAVDLSGNESALDAFDGSVAGPVRSVSDVTVEPDAPVKFLSGPVGTVHYSHVVFHWSRFNGSAPYAGYYFRLDGANWQWTTNLTVAYHDLKPGQHTFSVRPGGQEDTVSRSFTVAPVYTSEFEPNDSRDMSYIIRPGMVIRGDNTDGGDDWFRIHVPDIGGAVMDILFSRPESFGSTEIIVYANQPYREVGRFDSDGGQSGHLALGVAPNSDYFVHVSSTDDNTQYRLVAAIEGLPTGFAWEVEDNDTGASANPLEVNLDGLQAVEVRGSNDDPDWFRLHIPDIGVQHPLWLNICFHQAGIETASSVSIYSGHFDTADRQIGGFAGTQMEYPQFTGIVKPGGDYFVEINPAGDYQFLLSLTEIPIDDGTAWEVEPNGIVAWANPLALGVKQRGTSWDANEDDDWYLLDARSLMQDADNESEMLSLHFSRSSGLGSSLVELYNTSSQLLGSFQVDIASAQKGSINVDIEAGTYYVKVHPQNEFSGAEYELIALLVDSISLSRISADGEELERDDRPLKAGDLVQIELIWNAGMGQATFDVGDIAADLPMVGQDGVYSGSYTIATGDNKVAAPVIMRLLDQFGNATDIEFDETVTIDALRPEITEIYHDGLTPLSAGKKLAVTMIGESSGAASFDISGLKTGLDMYNMTPNEADPPLIIVNWDWRPDPTFGPDGTVIVTGNIKNISDSTKDYVKVNVSFYDANGGIVDSKSVYTTPLNIPPGVSAPFKMYANYTGRKDSARLQLVYGINEKPVGESADDGVYVGTYEVGDDDNILDATITCYLTDSAGNQSSIESLIKVTFDTVPPEINSLTHDAEEVLIEGDVLTVTLEGESGGEATFDIGDQWKGLEMVAAEPGKYVGTYRVRVGDDVTGALIIGHLRDLAGNKVSYIGVRTVSINTSAPSIYEVSHNGTTRSFIEGEKLVVTVRTDPGVKATFDVDGLIAGRIMYDDGLHDDEGRGDGIYKGSYIIRKGNNVADGGIEVTVVNPNGKSVMREALEGIYVDTELPGSVTGVSAADNPDDEGGYVILSWDKSDAEDFDHYNIYQSEQPIISLRNLEPMDEAIFDIDITTIEIAVPEAVLGLPEPTYYFAVTVTDTSTNESLLTRDSTDGPISGVDDLPPEPVGEVIARDRAYDNGKIITVSWSDPAVAEDFYRYHIYMDFAPIFDVSGLVPVDTSITDRNVLLADITVPEDGVDFFFAVTAVDSSGNESAITNDSIAGPIFSADNLGVAPDTPVRIISGPVGEIHYDDVTFIWNRWLRTESDALNTAGYYYKLDNGNWVWTRDTYKTYYDLAAGEHTFYVKADVDDSMPAERVFAVKRILLAETEPNNNGGQANWISKGMTITGTNTDDGDDDWFRFHVESDGLMTLNFSRVQGVGSTEMTVYRAFPPTVETSIGTLNANPMSQHQNLSTGVGLGDYFILVDSQGEDADAEYEISVTTAEIPEGFQWDREDNNLPVLAEILAQDNLELGVEVSGFGNRDSDVDWYRWRIAGTAFMELDFTRPRGIGITEISIYASFPHDLQSSKIGLITLQPINNQSQKFAIPVNPGDYYMQVDNSQEADISSIYSFRISLSPASGNWEIEPNGLSQFANPLPLNEVVKGASWHPNDDVDWYRLRLDKRGILVLSYFRPFGTGSAEIKLKAADTGDITATSANVFTGQKATLSADLGLGDYFVVVDPENEEDTAAEYQLVATVLGSIEMEIQYPELGLREPEMELSVMGIDSSVVLTVEWEHDNDISFEIGELQDNLPMSYDAQNNIYSGIYAVQDGDDISDAEVVLHLNMPPRGSEALWTADLMLEDKITIDTIPPKISRVEHNINLYPLSEGDTLNVTMNGEAGALDAYFDIMLTDESGNFLSTGIPRYSEIGMVGDANGSYSGSYVVEERDDLESAVVVCHLVDLAGNRSSEVAERPIFFDTTVPKIINVEHDAVETLVEGDILTVTVASDTINGEAFLSIDGLLSDRIMYDDGTHGDGVADDGVYTSQYSIRKGDNVADAVVTVRLADGAGNTSEEKAFEPISVDTASPEIASLIHDADEILAEDDVLTVVLNGEAGNFAAFDIGELQVGLPMYDDGTRFDDTSNDGVYVGTYTVKKGDEAKNARITGYLTDDNGNQTFHRIFERVNIDAVPPSAVSGLQVVDKPDDQGFWLVLTWDNSMAEDFHSYNIYREAAPITSILGLTPLAESSIVEVDTSESGDQRLVEVIVPSNGVDYYLAVTTSDEAGNESLLDKESGVVGPVQAFDNVAPEPVTIVATKDKPDDQGKSVVVSWTSVSTAEDFEYYGIYLSDSPIASLEGLDPISLVKASDTILVTSEMSAISAHGSYVTVPADDTDYYFAVTAFDKNGNESLLDAAGRSVAGPVRSIDDTPPQAVILVSVVDTPGDEGGSLDIWWQSSKDEEIQEYRFYLSQELISNAFVLNENPIDTVSADDVAKQDSVMLYELHPPADLGSFYVAVTAVDFGGNSSELDRSGRSVSDLVQAVSNKVEAGQSTTIAAGFDPYTSVFIPSGAISSGETVDILWPDESTQENVDEANRFLEGSHIDSQMDSYFIDTAREFEASTPNIFQPVEITLSYPDITEMQAQANVGSNIVFALTQDDELSFRIFRLNEASRIPRWELVSGEQEVNSLSNTVSVEVTKLGIFRVARLKLPESLNDVVVYPNPFIPSQSISGYITFKNLTQNATIQMFDMAGRRVRTIDKEIAGGDEARWDVRNSEGEAVASGTYIFFIQSQEDTFTGKLIILR